MPIRYSPLATTWMSGVAAGFGATVGTAPGSDLDLARARRGGCHGRSWYHRPRGQRCRAGRRRVGPRVAQPIGYRRAGKIGGHGKQHHDRDRDRDDQRSPPPSLLAVRPWTVGCIGLRDRTGARRAWRDERASTASRVGPVCWGTWLVIVFGSTAAEPRPCPTPWSCSRQVSRAVRVVAARQNAAWSARSIGRGRSVARHR